MTSPLHGEDRWFDSSQAHTYKMNCIIIHGCPSNIEKSMNPETRTYDKHWIPWIKKQLQEKGIEAETPLIPEP